MYAYETSFAVTGSVQRPFQMSIDKGMQRTRALDSLVLSRLHRLHQKPELLLYASADGQRPTCSSLFGRTTVLNSLSDLWNAVLKEPRTNCCFAQIVDEAPIGQNESARAALEFSLLKVKPFEMGPFEQLLEAQEKVFNTAAGEHLFIDPLQRFTTTEIGRNADRSERSEKARKPLLLVEGYVQIENSLEPQEKVGSKIQLQGRDCTVADFRNGLQGVSELFRQWDQWLGENVVNPAGFDAIYVYSQIKGLLPACWSELKARGVAPEQVRLPQWAGYANAISCYWEFLLAQPRRAAFLHIPLNGRCHFARLEHQS